MSALDDFGAGLADDATSTGKTAINSFDPTSTANSAVNGLNSLVGNQNTQSSNFAKQYADTIAANPSVTSLYQTGNDLYNVPGLQKTANYLNNSVTNAIPDQVTAARGSDIGQAQQQNAVASKLAYLTPQANAATTNLNSAQGLASQYVQAGQAQNAQNLLPIQTQATQLAAQQAAQTTGYTTEMSQELSGLIAKMQSGEQLSEAELTRANTLATSEEAYQQALAKNQTDIQTAQIGQEYQPLTAGQTLLNTFTGNIAKAS